MICDAPVSVKIAYVLRKIALLKNSKKYISKC